MHPTPKKKKSGKRTQNTWICHYYWSLIILTVPPGVCDAGSLPNSSWLAEGVAPIVDHQSLHRQAGTSDLLRVVVFLQGLLQLARDFLEESDLLLQVMLHLGLEVSHADLVEVLDLGQRGAGDDVAALVDTFRLGGVHLALLHMFLALLYLRQGACCWR